MLASGSYMWFISLIFWTIYGLVHMDIFHMTYLCMSYFIDTWIWILVLVLVIRIWNDIPLSGMMHEWWSSLSEGAIYSPSDRQVAKGHTLSSDGRHLVKGHHMSDDRHWAKGLYACLTMIANWRRDTSCPVMAALRWRGNTFAHWWPPISERTPVV